MQPNSPLAMSDPAAVIAKANELLGSLTPSGAK